MYNKKAIKGKIILSKIDFIESKNEPSLNNAWLSGFTDAEGCFTVSIKNTTGFAIRFILSQKHEENLTFLVVPPPTFVDICHGRTHQELYFRLINKDHLDPKFKIELLEKSKLINKNN